MLNKVISLMKHERLWKFKDFEDCTSDRNTKQLNSILKEILEETQKETTK